MRALEGKRVVLTGSRKIEEITALIEKQGGISVQRPIQETKKCSVQELEPNVRRVIEDGTDWAVFTTGIGSAVLFDAAEQLNLQQAFIEALIKARIAVRGYKTTQIMKKYGIEPAVIDDDGTNDGLLRALEPFSFDQQNIYLQLHGEPVPKLVQWFEERNADVFQVLPYQTVVPDLNVVYQLIEEIINGTVDVVAFTASPQVRVLFKTAEKLAVLPQMIEAFQEKVVAAAVGKVTGSELTERGVQRVIVPEHERMGAMIVAIAAHYKKINV